MRRAIHHLKTADPVLGGLIENIGPYRIVYRTPNFDALVRSIVSQQLSSKAAATIYARVQAVSGGGHVAPDVLLRLRTPALRKAGLSAQKIGYLRDLARLTCRGELNFQALPNLSDDEVIGALTQVKGIGVWTAHMFLIFALRRPDVLPVGDLGIQSAIQRAWDLPERPKPKQVEEIGARWRPWCSVASWYLWSSLGGTAGV